MTQIPNEYPFAEDAVSPKLQRSWVILKQLCAVTMSVIWMTWIHLGTNLRRLSQQRNFFWRWMHSSFKCLRLRCSLSCSSDFLLSSCFNCSSSVVKLAILLLFSSISFSPSSSWLLVSEKYKTKSRQLR